MQEIANITALIEELQNYDAYDDKLSNRQLHIIQPRLLKIKDELKNVLLKFNGIRVEMSEQLKNKMLEVEKKAQTDLEIQIKNATTNAYNKAYEAISKEFIDKVRCPKCGNNKITIKHDYRADVLDCLCGVCGFEWDKDCLDKK